MVEATLSNKRIDQVLKIPRSKYLTIQDVAWLYSRGGCTPDDCDLDEYGKFLKQMEKVEVTWGRVYLPKVYLPKLTDTTCLKLDKSTGKLYEPFI